MPAFEGLTEEAFATYSAEKWSSNVHNLPRMRAKDTMIALCEQVEQGLEQELDGLVRGASDEVPNILNQKKVDAQWVYWFRNPAARESLRSFLQKTPLDESALLNTMPQDKHATLAVVLNQTQLWLGLRVAPGAVVDRRNLAAMLEKSWEREQLCELLKDLPEGATVGLQGGATLAQEVNGQTFEDTSKQLVGQHPPWIIGHAVNATEAQELGTELVDHVRRWLGALLPLYRFVAWSQKNDHIDATKKIQEEKAQKRRQAGSFVEGDQVRIVSGLFSGKRGTVQDIDTKAKVRVRVGKMSVVVSGKDLVPVA